MEREDYNKRVFQHEERVAERSSVAVAMPKTGKHQQLRANVEAPTVEKYFEHSVLLPFLDRKISDLNSRFTKHVEKACWIGGLLPRNLKSDSTPSSIEEAETIIEVDWPYPDIVSAEFCSWKARWLSVPLSERPEKLEGCLYSCSLDSFQNSAVLLKLFAVVPLSSVACERSASVLYLRSS